jgi:Kef-type K+ transport system membrane component KefB
MNEIHALFVIGIVAVFAPLLTRLPAFARMPAVVLELLLGILIGPSGLGWVTSQGAIGFLGEFGLIFLFFQAGFEFNPEEIGAVPLRLGAIAWLAAFGLSVLFASVLYAIGLLHAPLLIALVLPTTAFGMLLPILHESGNLGTNFGRYVLGLAVAGELGPLVLAAIVLAHQHHHLHETILTVVFFAVAIGAILAAQRMRSRALTGLIAGWMHDRSILPVRIALLILLGLVSLANELGMELVLGAYTAGMVIAMLVRDTRAEILQNRLMSIGSGFFIPVFFITSGVEFDLPGLLTSPGSIARLILFCAGFLLPYHSGALVQGRAARKRPAAASSLVVHHAAACRCGHLSRRANRRHAARECARPRRRGRHHGRCISRPCPCAAGEGGRRATRRHRGHRDPPRR